MDIAITLEKGKNQVVCDGFNLKGDVMFKKTAQILAGILFLVFSISFSASAAVAVYAEGAYTENDLVLYIYADISTTAIVSYGVKLTYPETELENPTVEKNDSDWYFGTQDAPLPTPSATPKISTSGEIREIVIVGGKINEENPLEGVSGDRTLLAVVTFTRLNQVMPFEPAIGLSLGKTETGNYDNFVQVDGFVLDSSIPFDTKICQRGDANGNGSINISDVTEIRRMVFNEIPKTCYADCNDDGNVNISDVTCIRDKVFQ